MADDIQAPPPAQADPAITAQQEQMINVVDPDTQQIGSVPHSQLQQALDQGFTQATPDQADNFIREQKYGTAGQQVLTGIEGAAKTATFGLSSGLERALGVSPEAIRAREETNPGAAMVGEIGGLFVPGLGEAGLLGKAGREGAAALGAGAEKAAYEAFQGAKTAGASIQEAHMAQEAAMAPYSAVSKIGSAAAKNAVETAIMQGSDEVSKMLLSDPNQSAQTAIVDVGLAGLLGGTLGAGIGSISPLWNATVGNKVGGVLKGLSDRVGGIEGIVPDSVNEAIQTSGISIAPEVKAALSNDPKVRDMFAALQESSTSSGLKAQEALKTFKKDASDLIVSSLGKSPEEIANLADMSEYEAGASLKKSLVSQLKSEIDPISEQFNKVREQFKDLALPKDETVVELAKQPNQYEAALGVEPSMKQSVVKHGPISEISEKISNLATEKGWLASPSSPEAKMVGRIMNELPLQKTLNDLRNFQSLIGDDAHRQQLWHLGSEVKKIFRNVEDDIVTKALGDKSPELLASHAQARAAYKQAMDRIEDLNERLHVGRYSGPGSFIKSLDEMAPEDVLRRLSPKGDAALIQHLSERFPAASEQVKNFHLSQALKNAGAKAAPGESINSKVFFNAIDKMSPEMRQYILPAGASEKIEAIKHLLAGLPAKMNTSGTAKTLDALWNKVPGTAVGIISMIAGHNPATAYIEGKLTGMLSRDAPDAVRLQLLKFLGEGKHINASGFRSGVEYLNAAIKGENMVGKSVKNLFKAGAVVLPLSKVPSDTELKKLDKNLQSLRDDPSPLLKVGGDIGHYHDKAAQSLAQTAATSVTYLNNQRPGTKHLGILDKPVEPSTAEKAAYNRTLSIAQQPLVVLDKIKNGTLTPKDVADLKTIYPSLYTKLSQKMADEVVNKMSKGEEIPYKTRMGMSLFTGTPLDGTMSSSSIIAAQQAQMNKPGQQAQQAPPKASGDALSKLAGTYRTPLQQSADHKAKH